MTIEVSAPGKLILLGEYAVLFGAPAVVVAVSRRARVKLSASKTDNWQLLAPGLVPGRVELEVGDGRELRWHGDEDVVSEFGLVDRLLRELAEKRLIEIGNLAPVEAVLDTREFYRSLGDRRVKLGLGSSAALTVALTSALANWSGLEHVTRKEPGWLQALVDVHRGIQGGAGSGVDVAASTLGGVVNYRLAEDESVASATPSKLPDELAIVCVWTGRSASTGDFLERLAEQRLHRPSEVDRALGRLCEVSEEGVAALLAHRVPSFLEAVGEFWNALDALGRSIAMPILSDEHRRLEHIAEECGVSYKPSGAGGGDFGIAFTDDEVLAEEMTRRSSAAGFQILDLAVDPEGVTEFRS